MVYTLPAEHHSPPPLSDHEYLTALIEDNGKRLDDLEKVWESTLRKLDRLNERESALEGVIADGCKERVEEEKARGMRLEKLKKDLELEE